jgi:hypothetical protein
VMGPQRFPNPDDLDKSLVMFTHEVTLRTEHHQ